MAREEYVSEKFMIIMIRIMIIIIILQGKVLKLKKTLYKSEGQI